MGDGGYMNIKNKVPKFMVIGILVVVLIVSVVVGIQVYKNHSKEKEAQMVYDKIQMVCDKIVVPPNQQNQYNELYRELVSRENFLDIVEEMTNAKIETKYGQKLRSTEITPASCKAVLEYLRDTKYNFDSVEYKEFIDEVTRWTNGDYSKITYMHNMVREKLGGSIRKAIEN